MMLRVFYGGTFDPVHNGHLAVARAACAALDADINFLPAADPPHRTDLGANAQQRSQMLTLAIAHEPRFHLDFRELRRKGPSYTVDTLQEIRKELGKDAPMAWLLGADAFCMLNTWYHWRELFGLAHFVIALRPGFTLEGLNGELAVACRDRWCQEPAILLQASAGRLWTLELPPQPESASGVRGRLATGECIQGWVPATVANFIQKQGLYRPGYN